KIATEPVGVGQLGHAVDAADAVGVRDRQRLGEVDLVDDHEAVGVGDVLAGVEGAFEGGEHAEDGEGHEDRNDHQRGAQLLAEQILADEDEVVHAAKSFSMKKPLSRWRVRRAYLAAAGSCVTMTMVLPRSLLRSCSIERISSA